MENQLIFTLQPTWTVVTVRSQTSSHIDLMDWNIAKQTLELTQRKMCIIDSRV